MKVSVTCTVFNEEDTVVDLLVSLVQQTMIPGEIVIVDGGSRDNTVSIVKKFQKKYKYIKLFEEVGNIAHGRNVSIKEAKNDVIAQIDAGCWADPDWLKRITEPFADPEVEMVAGFYEMVGDSALQEASKPYYGVTPARFSKHTFMPSGRSVAFRKTVWEKVGGYDESLELAGEDTLFNHKAVRAGVNIKRVPDALVYWSVPVGISKFWKKIFAYAKGDAQTMILWDPVKKWKTHTIKILSIYLRYLVFLLLFAVGFEMPLLWGVLVISLVFYLGWSVVKNWKAVGAPRARLFSPLLQVVSDFAVMGGFLAGGLSRVSKL